MAEDIVVHGKVSIDTGNSAKSLKEYNDEIKKTQKELEGLEVGSKEYSSAQKKLTAQTHEMNAAVSKSGGTFGNLKQTLGGVVPGFDGAISGASGLGKQLWLLVANPIVAILAAIVAALALLYKAFASTNEGADKMDQIFAGIGAAIDVLRDRVLKVGEAISKFFAGDFKGALQSAKASVKGIGDEIYNEFKSAANATKILQDLEDSMRTLSVGRARLNRDLAAAKETMNDSDATFSQRRAALTTVRKAEQVQNAAELEQARNQFAALKQLYGNTDKSDDVLDKLADAESKVYDLEASSASQRRSLNKMDNSLRKEEQRKHEEWKKQQAEKQKKDIEDGLKVAEFNNKKIGSGMLDLISQEQKAKDEALKADSQRNVQIISLSAQRKNAAEFETNFLRYEVETRKRLADEELLHKQEVQAEVGQLLQNAMNVFGKNTIAGKALGIAQATMNTWIGATEAMKAKSVLPQPFDVISRIAAVASIVATGFKSVKAITAVQVPGGGGGGSSPSMPSMDISSPIAPRGTSTTLDSASIQGVGNAAAGGVGRSFVLDVDIRNNAERAARLNRSARLG